MGYALFTARKLMLQTRLNQMNYRLMVLSQQQQDMTQQTANQQMVNSFGTSAASIFAYQKYDLGKQALSKGIDISAYGPNGPTQAQIDAVTVPQDLTQSVIDKDTGALQAALNQSLNALQQKSASDALSLQATSVVGNQIDLEMKKLDSQIKETTAEMESVEKAEETAIKNSAPKYGGGAGG